MKWVYRRSTVRICKGIKLKSKLQHTGSRSATACPLPSLVLPLGSILPTPSSHYAFDRSRKSPRPFKRYYFSFRVFVITFQKLPNLKCASRRGPVLS